MENLVQGAGVQQTQTPVLQSGEIRRAHLAEGILSKRSEAALQLTSQQAHRLVSRPLRSSLLLTFLLSLEKIVADDPVLHEIYRDGHAYSLLLDNVFQLSQSR